MRTLAPRSLALLAAVALASVLVRPAAAPAEEAPLREVASFRPFPRHNTMLQGASVLDAARRHWFYASQVDGNTHVWLFDPDRLVQIGSEAAIPGGVGDVYALGLDEERGVLLVPHINPAGTWSVGAVGAGPQGPTVLADVPISGLTGAVPGEATKIFAAQVVQGRFYLLASVGVGTTAPRTIVARLDIGRLLSGAEPLDWTYEAKRCPAVIAYILGAVGKSRFEPTVFLPCATQTNRNDQLQGVDAIDMGSDEATSSSGFTETFYPTSGFFGNGASFFDPTSDRMMIRRTGPAQLVVFDGRHRRWMRPTLFGQNNVFQAVFDPTSGRLYGLGDDPAGGIERLFLLASEPRTTPPGNGITQLFVGAPNGYTTASGSMAFDPQTRRLFVADLDTVQDQFGNTVADGLWFRIFQDPRPPLAPPSPVDPDKEIINLSGEAQGYGARISYVGGVGGAYSNAFVTPYGGPVNGATRHATFARTLRLRLTEGEASSEAIAAQPEGATDAELQAGGRPWPYTSAHCSDFGSTPGENIQQGAKTNCQAAKRYGTSEAKYQADSADPYSNPVQKASTSSSVAIDATRGVVTTVTSEGSLDIPGIVHIGKATATTQTWAAGADGAAGYSYKRTMEDVTIGGEQSCSSSCDPDQVAKDINERFASTTDHGVIVQAEVPQPDRQLLASKGGAQAIVQRDFWDHEQDIGINEGADDRYEMPAFVITIYQDRTYANHEVYSLAGVQAVSRLPRSLHNKLQELQSAPEAFKYTQLPGTLGGGSIETVAGFEGTPGELVPGRPSQPGGADARVSRLIRHLGWGVVFPFRSPGVLAMWAFLAVPVFLASRRRLLLSRQAQRGVSS